MSDRILTAEECPDCELPGPHAFDSDCIEALRSRVTELEDALREIQREHWNTGYVAERMRNVAARALLGEPNR